MGMPLNAEVIRHEVTKSLTQEERDRVLAKAQHADSTKDKEDTPPPAPSSDSVGPQQGGGPAMTLPSRISSEDPENALLDMPDSSGSWLLSVGKGESDGPTASNTTATTATSEGTEESVQVLASSSMVEEGDSVLQEKVVGGLDKDGNVVSELVETAVVEKGENGEVTEVIRSTSTSVGAGGNLVVHSSTVMAQEKGGEEAHNLRLPHYSAGMVSANEKAVPGPEGGESSVEVAKAEVEQLLGVVLSAVTPSRSPVELSP